MLTIQLVTQLQADELMDASESIQALIDRAGLDLAPGARNLLLDLDEALSVAVVSSNGFGAPGERRA
jgi:hypothetical protein